MAAGTPEINQLFSQAVQLTTDLTAHAENAVTAATATAERAAALGALAEREGDALHQEVQQAIEALQHAREQVEHAAGAAADVLHSLPGRAHETETQIHALLAAVRDDVHEVEEARIHLLQGTDGSAKQLDAAFHALESRIQVLRQHTSMRTHEAQSHLDHLRQAVADAQSQVNAEGRELNDAFHALGKQAQEGMQTMDEALETALTRVGSHAVALCNAAIKGHNAAMYEVRHGFTSEVPNATVGQTWLATALEPLHNALTELIQLPGHVRDVIHAPLATVLDNGEKALTALGNIADSLHRALPRES